MLQTKFNIPAIYNPANQTREELIANFVVRLKEFHAVLDVIKKDKMKTPPQHFIIQGPRGSGKTTLLLRLFYAVSDNGKLTEFLIPVIFDEEQYNIRTLFKFWEEIALYLEDEHEALFHGIYDEMQKYIEEKDYEEICFNLLQKRLKEAKQKLVLFIDNFGDMLTKFQRKERQRLREVLIQCSDIRIAGGSSVVLEFLYDYSEPFFEFFKVIPLEELNQEDTVELFLQLSKTYKAGVVKDIVKNNPGRIEALRRLTSGVPRTMILLFEIFLDHEKGDSFQDLEIILDRVTPLYKHRMDSLPPQKQDIVDAIAMSWDAVGVKEIAGKTRIPGKSVSAQLNELEKNRIIVKIPTSTKNNLYQVAERFFNIWYLMRHGRKRERNKVLWLVRFMESWCNQMPLIAHNKKNIEYLKIGKIASSPPPYTTKSPTGTKNLQDIQELLRMNEIEKAIDMFNKFIENKETLNLNKELGSILLLLLAKKQFHFTYQLFKENKFEIRDKYKPIYYALMYFMRDQYPDEYKKMGPELKQTVEEIIEEINQWAIDYK
jgi:nucleoside-triphosphatase THEP1